jgi:hypothetical protein
MLDSATLLSHLAHCIGTANDYRHWLGLRYTDGIKTLAEGAECYWLMDAIASYQPQLKRQYPEQCDRQT